jgi:type VI secretion system secreted protein Hcp
MAFHTFVKIDSVPGECTDDKHKDWIAVFSYSHGVSQSGGGSVSSHGNRVAGKCDHQDFHLTKRTDKSSPKLFKQCCDGKHYPKVTVEICMDTGAQEVMQRFTLEHVLVTSLSCGGGHGQENPVENVSLNYGKIKWEYIPLDVKTGAKGAVVPCEWDLMTNKGA